MPKFFVILPKVSRIEIGGCFARVIHHRLRKRIPTDGLVLHHFAAKLSSQPLVIKALFNPVPNTKMFLMHGTVSQVKTYQRRLAFRRQNRGIQVEFIVYAEMRRLSPAFLRPDTVLVC